jgi:hypothetical protein
MPSHFLERRGVWFVAFLFTWFGTLAQAQSLPNDSRSSSTNGLSAADSLASFRPDSIDAQKFDAIENGRNSKDTAKAKQDTAVLASSLKLFLNRKPYYAAHAGVGFLDLNGREHFVAALEARRVAKQGKILQPYENVNLYFPAGFLAGMRVFDYLDILAKTDAFWYRQTALLGDSLNGPGTEEFYALQGQLLGLGLRLYIPQEILSARDHGHLYFEISRYFDLGATEIYSSYGSASAQWNPMGSTTEFQMGFMHSLDTRFTWSGALSFIHSSWVSNRTWNTILPNSGSQKVAWGGNALQMRFFLFWNPSYQPVIKPSATKAPGSKPVLK